MTTSTTSASTGDASTAASPAVALFQKVHGKMVMLQRLDAQLATLIEQPP
jgi:hypothetical protein